MAKKKLLFLFSDTGGGHRSSTEAVEEAINHLYPGQFTIDKVDFLKSHAPWPFNKLAKMYPTMVSYDSFFWQYGFKLFDYKHFYKRLIDFLWPYIKHAVSEIVSNYDYDLLVSFHPLINYPLTKFQPNLKYVVVITDLITANKSWYSGIPTLYLVPTLELKISGVNLGIDPKIITVTGLPISLRFKPKPKFQISNFKFQILLMGGGQGLGKLYNIAKSLNTANLPIKLIIVAGRNPKLELQLKALKWQIPVEIYGFTKEIPDLMQRSDILLTKAGPSTICEGLVTGLPIIIYDYLKGQETASVDYLVKNHAGLYCPTPKDIIHAIQSSQLNNLNTTSIATPNASMDIAKHLYKLVS